MPAMLRHAVQPIRARSGVVAQPNGSPPPTTSRSEDPAVTASSPTLRSSPRTSSALSHSGFWLALKRGIDLVGAALAAVVFAPVMLAVALAILIADGRPILFVQERVGLDGTRFRLVKFRTMVRDAEDRYDEVAALSDTRGAGFKMRDDPRVTRLGRWLRRSSLDELPQLWNVMRGDMSLVGPRPAPPREVECYDPWHLGRLSMKPGMTGMWQVASRFDQDFDQRASLDLTYIRRWSVWLDLVILIRTIPAVLLMTGR
jgi:lipopolysaccharide/colanic/teichoic acid biosynthesis glycosyltransferase